MTAALISTRPQLGDAVARRLLTVRTPILLWVAWRLAHLALYFAVGGTSVMGANPWDSAWYLRILRDGYAVVPESGPWQPTNFFPLLPWLTSAVQFVVRSEMVAMNLVVTVAQVAAVLMLWTVARSFTTERIATTAVALFLLFPASVHLWFFYSEGLFVALTAGSLYAAERGRMRLAGLLGVAVAMTRTIGAGIAVPLAAAVLQRHRRLDRELRWALLPFAGMAIVCLAQWAQAGDPFAFLEASRAWGTHTSFPLVTVWDRLQITHHIGYSLHTTLDLAVLATWIALAAIGLRSSMPWAYKTWMVLAIVAPLASGLTMSWTRYMFAAWPAFIVGAGLFDRASRPARVTVVLLLGFVTLSCLQDWHNGYFIS